MEEGMQRALIVAIVCVLLGSVCAPRRAQASSPAVKKLVEKATWWQKKGRADRAAEAWGKVLRSEPKHARALIALGTLAARRGDTKTAEKYVARLRRGHPGHPGITSLRRMISVGSSYDSLLKQARGHVRGGRLKQAVSTYDRAFGDGGPPPRLALEYWQTLGGIDGRWDEARRGLAGLVRRWPNRVDFKLAAGQHLTYRESHRRDGIAQLLALVGHSVAGNDARRSVRKALLWLRAKPSDKPLYDRYTSLVGPDPALKQRLPKPKVTVRKTDRVKAGYEALNERKLERAQKLFRAESRRAARNPDVLVGLATVALQRKDFARAQELLTQVSKLAPDRPQIWQRSLKSASFWAQMHKAAELRKKPATRAKALALYRRAREASPEEASHADLEIASLHAEAGRYEESKLLYESLLRADPDHVGALIGLINILLQRGKRAEAIALNRRVRELAPERALNEATLRSELLRKQAELASKGGQPERAYSLLLRAVEASPKSKWARLNLVYVLLSLNRIPHARKAADKLLAIAPMMVEARTAKARVLLAAGQRQAALDELQTIARGRLDEDGIRLRRRILVEVEARRALAPALRGKRMQARHQLMQLELKVQDDPEMMAYVATVWADLGRQEHALGLMNKAIAQMEKPPPGAMLQYASVLLRAGKDAEFLVVVNELAETAGLSGKAAVDLGRLRVAFGVRRADKLREQGHYTRALNFLAPLLRAYPKDKGLLTALARLFFDKGHFAEARAIYERVLKASPDNAEARWGAVQTASSQHRNADAKRLANQGIKRQPKNPRTHLIKARLHLLDGEDGDAMKALQRALALAERAHLSHTDKKVASSALTAGRKSPLSAASSTEAMLLAAQSKFVSGAKREAAGGMTLSVQREIRQEIDNLESRYHVDVTTDMKIRRRNGETGLGELTEFRVPIQLNLPIGYRGWLGFRATPVLVDAGLAALDQAGVAQRYGSLGAEVAAGEASPVAQSATGVEVGLSYRSKGLTADLGSTPLGFLIQNVVGGLKWRSRFGPFGLSLGAHRRAVSDSLLSYSGLKDPRSNKIWGGVVRQGLRADAAYGSDAVVYWIYGELDALVGLETQDNTRVAAGAGTEWKLHDWNNNSFTTGLAVSYMSYSHNLRNFTLGHGGYFSPQSFIHVGVPFIWRGAMKRLRWEVLGKAGINFFNESAIAYYPTDQGLQNQIDQIVDGDGKPVTSSYADYSSLAFALDTEGRLAYRLAGPFEAGLLLSIHTADDYRELIGAIYVRFDFQARARAGAPPLRMRRF